jgi:hypothetical protein
MIIHQVRTALRNGFTVFPVTPGGKTPLNSMRWGTLASNSPATIEHWWTMFPEANYAIACKPSGLLVVDCDMGKGSLPPTLAAHNVKDGEDAYAQICAELGQPFPWDTLTVRTPSGGAHYYYRNPAGTQLTQRPLATGWIDIRSNGGKDGGYVLGPGSHIGGVPYRVENPNPAADAPAWLIGLCTEPPIQRPTPAPRRIGQFNQPGKTNQGLLDALASAAEGNRNAMVYWAARSLRDDGHDIAVTNVLILDHLPQGTTPAEAAQTIRSAYNAQ